MKPRHLAIVLLALGLSACGNKGSLVLPTAPPAEDAPPVESPAPATPTPETLNDTTHSQPPQGDASEAGTPPPSAPPHP